MEEKLVLGFWYQEKRGSISCTNKFSCVVDLHLVPLLACKHRRNWVIYWKDYFGNIFTTTYNHLFCINIDLILCIICFWISQKQSRYHVILETSSLGKDLDISFKQRNLRNKYDQVRIRFFQADHCILSHNLSLLQLDALQRTTAVIIARCPGKADWEWMVTAGPKIVNDSTIQTWMVLISLYFWFSDYPCEIGQVGSFQVLPQPWNHHFHWKPHCAW